MDRNGRKKARKKSLAVSVAWMALYWPTPGFRGRMFKLCILTRWDFNFCVRSSPARGFSRDKQTSLTTPKHGRMCFEEVWQTNKLMDASSVQSDSLKPHQPRALPSGLGRWHWRSTQMSVDWFVFHPEVWQVRLIRAGSWARWWSTMPAHRKNRDLWDKQHWWYCRVFVMDGGRYEGLADLRVCYLQPSRPQRSNQRDIQVIRSPAKVRLTVDVIMSLNVCGWLRKMKWNEPHRQKLQK